MVCGRPRSAATVSGLLVRTVTDDEKKTEKKRNEEGSKKKAGDCFFWIEDKCRNKDDTCKFQHDSSKRGLREGFKK